jgi:hypothetical protein
MWSLLSFDQFHTFMMSTSNYLTSRAGSADGFVVDRPILLTSVLGRFVRKCRLEYVKLDFEGAGLLWSLFEVLRTPNSKSSKGKIVALDSQGIDGNLGPKISENASTSCLILLLIAISLLFGG